MKCVIVNKSPFGVTEINDVVSITNPVGSVAITSAVRITNMVNGSTVTRDVSTNDAVIQIFE